VAELHESNPVGRFADRAEDYVKYRPTYPADAVTALLSDLGPPERVRAADIGAGTGISARLMADRGVRVVAVEPGNEMRQAAAPHKDVMWVQGKAEATGLATHAFDLIVCAQSFHWFQTREALREFARILKNKKRLAIMWNRRSRIDPLTAGYRQAIRDVNGETAAERTDFDPEVITRSGLFSRPSLTSFPNAQRLDLNGLIGRARSASYVPKAGPVGEQLLKSLRALHAQHADGRGFVTLVYDTEVYCSAAL